MRILVAQKQFDVLAQLVENWVLQDFRGTAKFYTYMLPFLRPKVTDKQFSALQSKAIREFPDDPAILQIVSQTAPLCYQDYMTHFRNILPQDIITELEQLREIPRYEKDVDFLTFLAVTYQKAENYLSAITILRDCLTI